MGVSAIIHVLAAVLCGAIYAYEPSPFTMACVGFNIGAAFIYAFVWRAL